MDGFEFERFCCELLKRKGYRNVHVTQASGDYGIDVVATTQDGFVCGIQCKNYQGAVGIAAVQQAAAGCGYYNCDVAIVLTNSTFTSAAKNLAENTKVKLWDRDRLCDMIKVFPEKVVVPEPQPQIDPVSDNTNRSNPTKNAKKSSGKPDTLPDYVGTAELSVFACGIAFLIKWLWSESWPISIFGNLLLLVWVPSSLIIFIADLVFLVKGIQNHDNRCAFWSAFAILFLVAAIVVIII